MEKRLFEIVKAVTEAAVPTRGDGCPPGCVPADINFTTDCNQTSFFAFDEF
jgi:hypothetical protein